jgi:Uma2 family endonuclease
MLPATISGSRSAPGLVTDEVLYEVIDGQRVEIPRMGAHETWIASIVLGFLQRFADPQKLGRPVVETLFDLGLVGQQKRPDVAFVSSARWPYHRSPPRGEAAWKVVPNLAIEVVSPSNTADEVLVKMHEYFQAGVQLVWVIYPEPGEVYVYESPLSVRVLTRADVLDGGKVLPGFQLPLASLFEEQAETGDGTRERSDP